MDRRKTTRRCAASSARRIRSSPGLGQFAGQHNPLGLIPQARVRQHPERPDRATAAATTAAPCSDHLYDGRWPIYGNDIAINVALNLTHTRGTPHLQDGASCARTSSSDRRARDMFGGKFNFADDSAHPNRTRLCLVRTRCSARSAATRNRSAVCPTIAVSETWAWYVQDTWKMTPKVTFDLGLRMYKWGPYSSQGGKKRRPSARNDSIHGGAATRPCSSSRSQRHHAPAARIRRTGQILPATYIGLIVPGTGYTCAQVLTAQTPCTINGFVTQDDGNYLDSGDEGFIEPSGHSVRSAGRHGVGAESADGHPRAGVGSFHDGYGGNASSRADGNAAYRLQPGTSSSPISTRI